MTKDHLNSNKKNSHLPNPHMQKKTLSQVEPAFARTTIRSIINVSKSNKQNKIELVCFNSRGLDIRITLKPNLRNYSNKLKQSNVKDQETKLQLLFPPSKRQTSLHERGSVNSKSMQIETLSPEPTLQAFDANLKIETYKSLCRLFGIDMRENLSHSSTSYPPSEPLPTIPHCSLLYFWTETKETTSYKFIPLSTLHTKKMEEEDIRSSSERR